MVDDALSAELNDDASTASGSRVNIGLVDGVPGESFFHVVVLGVSVQQGCPVVPLDHQGSVLRGGNILLVN